MDGIRKSTLDALRPAVKMAEWSPQGARTTCANRNFVDRVVPIAQAVPFRLFGLRSARFISGSSLDCEATGPVDLDERLPSPPAVPRAPAQYRRQPLCRIGASARWSAVCGGRCGSGRNVS